MAEVTRNVDERIADIRNDYGELIEGKNTKRGRKERRRDKHGNIVEIEWIDDVEDGEGGTSVHVIFG